MEEVMKAGHPERQPHQARHKRKLYSPGIRYFACAQDDLKAAPSTAAGSQTWKQVPFPISLLMVMAP